MNKIKCLECGKYFIRITNTHLEKEHKMTTKKYLQKHPTALVEDPKVSFNRQNHKRGKTYSEIYGKQAAKMLNESKSRALTKYAMIEVKCKYCDKVFQKKENSSQECCSAICGFNAMRKGFKTVFCPNCDKAFTVHKNSTQQFCSNKCVGEFNMKKGNFTTSCRYCGKPLLIKNYKLQNSNNLFCTHECKIKYKAIQHTDYRIKAYMHYGRLCERCGDTNNLVVHHKDGNRLNNDINNLMVICRGCHSKLHKILDRQQQRFVGQADVEQGMVLMLRGLQKRFGLNISNINFRDTPKRVARFYDEIFEGINATDEIEQILSTAFPTTYDGMVVESPIRCYSMCPHHFLPVIYDISVGYIPQHGGLGLSKLPRLIELLAKAPKIQEDFTQQVVDMISKSIHPKGIICVVRGNHMCMQMRGAKQSDCVTTTSAFHGVFKKKEPREEFFALVNKN